MSLVWSGCEITAGDCKHGADHEAEARNDIGWRRLVRVVQEYPNQRRSQRRAATGCWDLWVDVAHYGPLGTLTASATSRKMLAGGPTTTSQTCVTCGNPSASVTVIVTFCAAVAPVARTAANAP
jgi:hypothetical protein